MAYVPQRQMTLACRGFHWRDGTWQRGRLRLSDWTIDHLPECCWQALLRSLDAPGCPTCGRAWAAGLGAF
jgi:hypothetical protein